MKTRYDPPQESHPYDTDVKTTPITLVVTHTRGEIDGCQRCRPSLPTKTRGQELSIDTIELCL
jgi:hypothetical protein